MKNEKTTPETIDAASAADLFEDLTTLEETLGKATSTRQCFAVLLDALEGEIQAYGSGFAANVLGGLHHVFTTYYDLEQDGYKAFKSLFSSYRALREAEEKQIAEEALGTLQNLTAEQLRDFLGKQDATKTPEILYKVCKGAPLWRVVVDCFNAGYIEGQRAERRKGEKSNA